MMDETLAGASLINQKVLTRSHTVSTVSLDIRWWLGSTPNLKEFGLADGKRKRD